MVVLVAIAAGTGAGVMGLIHTLRVARSVTCDIPGAPMVIVEQCRLTTQSADVRDDRDAYRISY